MKNRVLIILAISFMMGTAAYSQNQQIGKSYTRSFVDKDFSLDKVYNKATGAKVSERDYRKIHEENPKLYLEREIDEEGHVVRYLYDPNNPTVSDKPNLMTNIPEKGSVPNFKLTAIDGNKIELNKLQGKLVIVRFEKGAGDFRFKKNEIADLDKKINSLKNKENIEAIIIFECPEDEVRKGFDLKDSNFKLIADGRIFGIKYDVHFYPTTLLIDQNGKLIKVFFYSDDINLEEYMK
jgi:peroxiredoxin